MIEKTINMESNIYNSASSEQVFANASIWRIFEWSISFIRNTHPSSISSFKTANWHFNVFWTDSENYSIDTDGKTMANMWTVNFSWTVTNTKLSWLPTTIGTHSSVYNRLSFNFNIYYKNTLDKAIRIYEVKPIWQWLKVYLFWRLPNWEWWNWE